jgi:hypothetical protein
MCRIKEYDARDRRATSAAKKGILPKIVWDPKEGSALDATRQGT